MDSGVALAGEGDFAAPVVVADRPAVAGFAVPVDLADLAGVFANAADVAAGVAFAAERDVAAAVPEAREVVAEVPEAREVGAAARLAVPAAAEVRPAVAEARPAVPEARVALAEAAVDLVEVPVDRVGVVPADRAGVRFAGAPSAAEALAGVGVASAFGFATFAARARVTRVVAAPASPVAPAARLAVAVLDSSAGPAVDPAAAAPSASSTETPVDPTATPVNSLAETPIDPSRTASNSPAGPAADPAAAAPSTSSTDTVLTALASSASLPVGREVVAWSCSGWAIAAARAATDSAALRQAAGAGRPEARPDRRPVDAGSPPSTRPCACSHSRKSWSARLRARDPAGFAAVSPPGSCGADGVDSAAFDGSVPGVVSAEATAVADSGTTLARDSASPPTVRGANSMLAAPVPA